MMSDAACDDFFKEQSVEIFMANLFAFSKVAKRNKQ